ncbi:MAG: DUF6133 family protein [Ruminococcus sp.]|nr:DUF6133 family protein [Ruminococcus sp.]
MKSFCKNAVSKVRNSFTAVQNDMTAKAHTVLDGTKAEAYVDTGVKILIAVVIGALLLTLLYTLFNSTIMPKVTEKVNGLFNYAG